MNITLMPGVIYPITTGPGNCELMAKVFSPTNEPVKFRITLPGGRQAWVKVRLTDTTDISPQQGDKDLWRFKGILVADLGNISRGILVMIQVYHSHDHIGELYFCSDTP